MVLLDILIYLITGGLFITITARLRAPLNLVVAAIVWLLLIGVSTALNGFGAFTVCLALWCVIMVGGLYGLREYLRHQ